MDPPKSDLVQVLLRGFFGEVGDKTFWLTALLGCWCPWEGVRHGNQLALQQLLVFLGALVGLLAHMIMLAVVHHSWSWRAWTHRSWIFETITSCTLLLLSLRAYLGSAGASRNFEVRDLEIEALAEPQQYRKDAFALPVAAPSANSEQREVATYGAVSDSNAARLDGSLGERSSDQTASTALAFFVAGGLTFLAEAEDKSWYALAVAGGHFSALAVAGTMLGFALAVLIAVALGHMMWFQLEARLVRYSAIFIFLALSLVSCSQALLHIATLEPHPVEAPRSGLVGVARHELKPPPLK